MCNTHVARLIGGPYACPINGPSGHATSSSSTGSNRLSSVSGEQRLDGIAASEDVAYAGLEGKWIGLDRIVRVELDCGARGKRTPLDALPHRGKNVGSLQAVLMDITSSPNPNNKYAPAPLIFGHFDANFLHVSSKILHAFL